jgi:hypothetical protein
MVPTEVAKETLAREMLSQFPQGGAMVPTHAEGASVARPN